MPTLAPPPSIPIRNPATGELVREVPTATPEDVALAARRARAAQVAWAARTWRERARVLGRFHDLVLERAPELLDTIQSETGKARRDALAEVITVAGTARYYLAHGRRHLARHRARGGVPILTSARTVYHPHGVVGLITPWNFPFILSVADALPALLAGNAVLVKPSEVTPLSAMLGRDLLVEAGLDPDLFQLLVGAGADLGRPFVDAVDYVGFTGSTVTGRIVAVQAAERLIPFSLELGGKNPMLVMPGARIADAVQGLVTGAFANSGQTCICIERCYVHESIWDEFTRQAVEATERLRVGWSSDFDVDMGSLTSVEHADRVVEHLDDARAQGATFLTGGSRLADLGPAFVAPTIVTDTTSSMLLHDAETFGPVVRLERVSSPQEAVERANASEYGLNGSVWAGQGRRARELAEQLVVGTAGVNSTLLIYNSYDVPMGGVRESGLGRRHGAAGIRRYVREQSIVGSFSRGGGYEQLLGMMTDERRVRQLLGVVKLWRRIPGIR